MLALICLHAVVGLVVLALGSRLGRRSALVALVAPAAASTWLVIRLPGVLDGRVVTEQVTWVGGLGLSVDLRLDAFGALLVALVAGIGVLVFAYAATYLPAEGEGVGRLVGLLTLFSGAMLLLVLADNLLLLYVGWELTSVTSYLLIGNDRLNPRARAAALQALLVTGAGGLAMFVGFVLLGQAAGTYRLSALLAAPPSGPAVTVALVLVVVGAAAKSAQYPFHGWLPGAMVAPTPVSAYLHSATMVKAGVYLVGRFGPAFAAGSVVWRPLVLSIGLVTMVAAGLRALRQHDLKLLLAYGTVSQLGFLFVLFGAGTPDAALAGCALLLAHAMFKAALFLVVGIIEHETGTRDMRALRGLGAGARPVVAIAVVSAASMAGVPLVFGFVAKEAAFAAFTDGGDGVGAAAFVLAVLVLGSTLTVAYSLRFVWGALTPGATDWAGAPPPAVAAHAPPPSLWLPPALLAALTVVLGVAPSLVEEFLGDAAASLVGGPVGGHLVRWPGFSLPLVLSALALAGGVLLFVARRPVAPVLAWGRRIPRSSDVYLAGLRGLNRLADRVTGVVQSGSLPTYAGVILLTAAVVPGVALLSSSAWPGWPEVLDAPAHVPVVAALVGGAIGAATVRRRLPAVVFLGVVGYAMAGLYVIEGAPDLALTQVTVETLSTVLFVLVLRRLPDRFSAPSAAGRPFRLAVAGAVAALVFGFALVAAGNRTAPAVSEQMVADALPEGGGRNVVNVILVDIRGFDTMGEVTVLAAAAVGAVALARAGRRPRPRPEEPAS